MSILRIYKVTIEPASSEDEAVPLSYPDSLGQQTKFGGAPCWVQGDDTPICPHCGERMTFVAQLDSFEHQSDRNRNGRDPLSGDQHFMVGDVGMIFVFFCSDCCEPATIFQSY